MALKEWFTPGSYKWKYWMKYAYGIGAAIVVCGALFKIEHWPGASIMIIVGMLTETVVFFLSAFEPVPHEYDWSLVYPELLGGEGGENKKKKSKLKELEEAVEKSQLTPETFLNLERGILSLKEQAEKMSDIGNAVLATTEYAEKVKLASGKVEEITTYYEKAARSMEPLSSISVKDSEELASEIQALKQNTARVNAAYQSYLKASEEQLGVAASLTAEIKNYIEQIKNAFSSIEKISTGMSSLTGQTEGIVEELRSSSSALINTLKSINTAFEPLTPQQDGKITELKENLIAFTEKVATLTDIWQQYAQSLSNAIEGLQKISGGFETIQRGYEQTIQAISAVNEQLARTAQQYEASTAEATQQFSAFADHLRKLNRIYGGMLSAMTYRPE